MDWGETPMKKSSPLLTIILLIILMGSLSGCLQQPIKINGIELRTYQGQSLNSINDFRENSIKGPQYINITTYQLSINGLVQNPKNYTYAELLETHQSYKKVLILNCVEGWSVKILWEGILLKDILNESHLLPTANTILFTAADGYTTSFPLDYIINQSIMLAYKMNNVTMPPERGYPFQLAAEGKWGYKWIKWVTDIDITNDPSYRGYWESRGYSNIGNLNESFSGP
jgi:DMSO/TMAO reductase YedYZ molybdopterin-dependent catalytic subunit